MIGTLTIIRPNGQREEATFTKTLPLEALQKAVGGYIEIVPHFDSFEGKRAVAFCNEEGKLHGLPYNPQATRLWATFHKARGSDYLVGSIAIVTGDTAFMEAL